MDITPLVPETSKVIQGYGNFRFKINGEWMSGNIIVFPSHVIPWEVASPDAISLESFYTVNASTVELLLIGLGKNVISFPSHLRQELKSRGIAIECMDTGAACRTYNVLLSEGRKIAVALIAIE